MCGIEFSPEPMLKALECNVRGVSLSGTGPSFVALVDRTAEAELYSAWSELDIEGRIIKTRINNEPAYKYDYNVNGNEDGGGGYLRDGT